MTRQHGAGCFKKRFWEIEGNCCELPSLVLFSSLIGGGSFNYSELQTGWGREKKEEEEKPLSNFEQYRLRKRGGGGKRDNYSGSRCVASAAAANAAIRNEFWHGRRREGSKRGP